MMATRGRALVAFVIAAGLGALVSPEPAEATPVVPHCITASGIDLNELWGVSEAIVTHDCTRIPAGAQWRPNGGPWFVNHSFAAVPVGFVPAAATPIEDFKAKFAAVRYVIDPGTNHEQTRVFPNDGDLPTAVSLGLPVVNTLAVAALEPLPAGPHVVEVYWQFNAMHCDGLGDDAASSCLPAGETQMRTLSFEVVEPQPDLQVRKGAQLAFVGDDVYWPAAPGGEQNVQRKGPPGAGGTFQVLIENDGANSDTFTLLGTRAGGKYTVKYLDASTDVTPAVTAGSYEVTLDPGATKTLTVNVKSKPTAVPGAKKPFHVTAAGTDASTDRVSMTWVTT